MTENAPTLADRLAGMTAAERAEFTETAERVAASLAELEDGRAVSLAVRTAATAVTKPFD